MDSVGYNASTKVDNRSLITQHGLEGMKRTTPTGPGKQIIDKYYYQSLFKQKINDVSKEMISLKGEIEQINKDVNEYNNLNKTFETLSKEVQYLEGELADYNLAGDKFRSSMRSEDIEAVYNHIMVNYILIC